VTTLVLVALCAAAAQPAWRLLSQVIWLRFCDRLLKEPDGIQRLRQAGPYVLAGLAAVGGHPKDQRSPAAARRSGATPIDEVGAGKAREAEARLH
jgi:hypothetical protein